MTYNSCSTFKWNNGASFPIGSGHGCIGCSEANFWDNGPFDQRLTAVPLPGEEANADQVGETLAVAAGGGVAAHFAAFAAKPLAAARRERKETEEKA